MEYGKGNIMYKTFLIKNLHTRVITPYGELRCVVNAQLRAQNRRTLVQVIARYVCEEKGISVPTYKALAIKYLNSDYKIVEVKVLEDRTVLSPRQYAIYKNILEREE